MIPIDMRDDTELVLWMLNLHHIQNEKEVELLEEYNKVEDSAKASELEKIELSQKFKRIQKEVTALKDDIPWNYLALIDRIEKSKTQVSRVVSKSISSTRDWWYRLKGT
jgi:predicted  nucleic acid-binding Zn-ribbon protein